MILRGTIIEEVKAGHTSVIVRFEKDKTKQHFELKCEFNPWTHKMRKWDLWDFKIRFSSEIFTDPKTQQKSYFTHLICSDARLFHENGSVGNNY